MTLALGINGFGRIGRLVMRAARDHDVSIAGINDLTDPATLAHLLRHDSVHGHYPGVVECESDAIVVDGQRIPILSERDPARLSWGKLGARIVVESTGLFTSHEMAEKHIEAGAERVIISAPSPDPDVTIVLGVNSDDYDPLRHHIVSNASCTTNCLAPIAKVLDEACGIEAGWMNTIHAYTNDQLIQDGPHKDLRRGRCASNSMIPTSTGAARAIGLVLPRLAGRLDGLAVRVPTADVSILDLSLKLERSTDAESINAMMKEASQGALRGYLRYCEEPLVSVDFIGDPHSAILDAPNTRVMNGDFAKILAWYDNETGYATRLVELAEMMGT